MTPYLPVDTPMPPPDPWERAFWDHCRDKRLMFQACGDCGRVRHPPMPYCPHCRATAHEWRPAGDDATLFTWTIVHHPSHPALAAAVPYVVAVVEFPSLQNVRLLTNLIDVPFDAIYIGMPLALVWQDLPSGAVLPRFTAKGDAR